MINFSENKWIKAEVIENGQLRTLVDCSNKCNGELPLFFESNNLTLIYQDRSLTPYEANIICTRIN